MDKKRVNEFGFSDEAPAPDPAQIGSAPADGVVTSEHADSTAAVQSTGRKDATIKGVRDRIFRERGIKRVSMTYEQ